MTGRLCSGLIFIAFTYKYIKIISDSYMYTLTSLEIIYKIMY